MNKKGKNYSFIAYLRGKNSLKIHIDFLQFLKDFSFNNKNEFLELSKIFKSFTINRLKITTNPTSKQKDIKT